MTTFEKFCPVCKRKVLNLDRISMDARGYFIFHCQFLFFTRSSSISYLTWLLDNLITRWTLEMKAFILEDERLEAVPLRTWIGRAFSTLTELAWLSFSFDLEAWCCDPTHFLCRWCFLWTKVMRYFERFWKMSQVLASEQIIITLDGTCGYDWDNKWCHQPSILYWSRKYWVFRSWLCKLRLSFKARGYLICVLLRTGPSLE